MFAESVSPSPMRINRIIMEFKSVYMGQQTGRKLRINRIIMEFKSNQIALALGYSEN